MTEIMAFAINLGGIQYNGNTMALCMWGYYHSYAVISGDLSTMCVADELRHTAFAIQYINIRIAYK